MKAADAIGVGALVVFAVWGASVWRDHAAYERLVKAEHDATFGTTDEPSQREIAVVNAPAVARRFGGIVEATDYSCYADAVCVVKVAGVDVTTGMGRTTGARLPWGASQEVKVGETVDVHCRGTTANACTLEGDAAYFLRRRSP